ncbi:hypothetical protein TNCV_2389471 [Trichonephila clavipes]|nr:hypothetical protein TNCV_2389471 [Trichonephila clavipes]
MALKLRGLTGFVIFNRNKVTKIHSLLTSSPYQSEGSVPRKSKRAIYLHRSSMTSRLELPESSCDRGSLVVKVSDRGWLVTSSSPVPLKTHRVSERCTLNLSRAQTSSSWCGVVVRRGGASSGVIHVT